MGFESTHWDWDMLDASATPKSIVATCGGVLFKTFRTTRNCRKCFWLNLAEMGPCSKVQITRVQLHFHFWEI